MTHDFLSGLYGRFSYIVIMREDSSFVWEAQGSARAELEGVRPHETVIQIANSHPAGHSRAPELAR